MEVSALKPTALPGPRTPGSLLRLQSDERLIALTRRGQQAAFEALFSRYHARLLSFCRHMLGSKEDAEDVLQEVFAAAFNAILADERAINVRPWLYRIARNRSLNHLRRASAIGVDSMDVHFAEHGMSTGEQVLRRESFRQLIGDVQRLPETQRTALLLREIDALSYEQIAQAMETTVPSVKSLLVRARISLAEAAEARLLSCDEVRLRLGEAAEGLVKIDAAERRHMRDCERCRAFRKHLKDNNHALAAILPVGPLLLLKKLVLTKFGSTASAGAGHAVGAGGAGATATAGASAGVSAVASAGAGVGGMGMGGLATAGAGALATKAAATLAAAAIVTAGAVEVDHSASRPHRRRPSSAFVASTAAGAGAAEIHAAPAIVRSTPQPASALGAHHARLAAAGAHRHGGAAGAGTGAGHTLVVKVPPLPGKPGATSTGDATTPPGAGGVPGATGDRTPGAGERPPVTQVTTESTPLPSPSTGASSTDTGTGTTSTITTPPTPAPAEEAPATTPASPPAPPPAAGEETTGGTAPTPLPPPPAPGGEGTQGTPTGTSPTPPPPPPPPPLSGS